MTTNGAPPATPTAARRLDSDSSATLIGLVEMFDDLQMVLRCCERLVEDVAPGPHDPDELAVEALWTVALLSYARCFTPTMAGIALTDEDLKTAQPEGDVLEWHQVLIQLREHYADPAANPREQFSVGVTQDANGAASGVAITSARQPLVDDLTVRQTGAIAYVLSGLVNSRIEAQQEKVFEELKNLSTDDLDKLDQLDIAQPVVPPVASS